MTMLAKVLMGAAAVSVVGTGIAVYANKKKAEKVLDAVEEAFTPVEDREEELNVVQRIKKFVRKKVIKFLAWVALHMEQIEAVSAVIGLASGAIGIATAVRDFRKGNDMQEQLDCIETKLDAMITTYNDNVQTTNGNMDKMFDGFRGVTHNQELIYNAITGEVA